jgi:hypothetical protein
MNFGGINQFKTKKVMTAFSPCSLLAPDLLWDEISLLPQYKSNPQTKQKINS